MFMYRVGAEHKMVRVKYFTIHPTRLVGKNTNSSFMHNA